MRRHGPFRHWLRHVASVPKGFLRYYVLKLLAERSLSGSEIMNEIESRTNGHWKPSPGSIYPLLSWLKDKKFIKEAAEQEVGLKRYTLTEDGKAFLEEHVERSEELRKKFSLFKPPFFGFPWLNYYPEKTRELFEAGKKLVMSSWNVLDNLRENYSDEAATEAKAVIEEAAEKMDEIAKKLST